MRPKRPLYAPCHPNRKTHARNLCGPCYVKIGPRQAPCHPDKKVHARDLCANCYFKLLKRINPEFKKRQDYNRNRWATEHSKDPQRVARRRAVSRLALLERKYGLSPEHYLALVHARNGRCDICRERSTRLVVDHDHISGRLRGLLCHYCNLLLGHAKDDVRRLCNAISYLQWAGRRLPSQPPIEDPPNLGVHP